MNLLLTHDNILMLCFVGTDVFFFLLSQMSHVLKKIIDQSNDIMLITY